MLLSEVETLEVEVKQRTTAHQQSVGKTSGGTGVDELTTFEQRVVSIVGDTIFYGVVLAALEDSDLQRDCREGNFTFIHITYQPALKFHYLYLYKSIKKSISS